VQQRRELKACHLGCRSRLLCKRGQHLMCCSRMVQQRRELKAYCMGCRSRPSCPPRTRASCCGSTPRCRPRLRRRPRRWMRSGEPRRRPRSSLRMRRPRASSLRPKLAGAVRLAPGVNRDVTAPTLRWPFYACWFTVLNQANHAFDEGCISRALRSQTPDTGRTPAGPCHLFTTQQVPPTLAGSASAGARSWRRCRRAWSARSVRPRTRGRRPAARAPPRSAARPSWATRASRRPRCASASRTWSSSSGRALPRLRGLLHAT